MPVPLIKGNSARKADHPVAALFVDRWSPRAMSGAEIPLPELLTLFEAARWAPSAFNNQPWRMLYARRGTPHWPLFFDLLAETNRIWNVNAAALALFISKTSFDHNGQPSRTHSFDTGAAWENFALQGALSGFVVHGMQGFDYDQARTRLGIPEGFHVEAMVAVGLPAPTETLPQPLREKEFPKGRRNLDATLCEGPFRF